MTTPRNVIPFGPRAAGADMSTEDKRLVNECQATARRLLGAGLQRLFEKADDTLFEFANKPDAGASQPIYFEAMRTLRLKRVEVAKAFIERLGKTFARLERTETDGATGPSIDFGSLKLVDEAELEESIAMKGMVDKANGAYAEDLNALEQRFAFLAGLDTLPAERNPLAPANLCEAFKEATAAMEVPIEARLILYKLFDKFVVVGALGEMYAAVNKQLADAGILPQIKTPTPRAATNPGRPKGDAAHRSGAQPADEGEDGGAGDAELLPLLRQMLAGVRGPGSGAGAGGGSGTGGTEGGPIHVPSTQELMQALTSLQHHAPAPAMPGTGADAPVGEQVRLALDEELKQAIGAAKASLKPQDNDIIDLISMLFEFILEDRSLADSVRALLARLQIPLLKVALIDRGFFSKKRHPARRLLNALAQAGLGLDDQARPETSPRLAMIDRIVRRVLDEFSDDVGLFASLLDELDAFLAEQGEAERAAAEEQSADLREREKQQQTHAEAAAAVDDLIQRHGEVPMPALVILNGPWIDFLAQARRKDASGKLWNQALRFAEQLLWSVTPKPAKAERLEVARAIPSLLTTLRAGLASIDYPQERADALLQSLEPLHVAVFRGEPMPSMKPAKAATEPDRNASLNDVVEAMEAQLANLSDLESIFEEEPGAGSEESAAPEEYTEDVEKETIQVPDEFLQQAREVDVGTWVSFTRPDGSELRAKLGWKSEVLDECVFLDWKFKVVAEKSMRQLALDLYEGTASVVEAVPMVDRALDALVNRLRPSAAS